MESAISQENLLFTENKNLKKKDTKFGLNPIFGGRFGYIQRKLAQKNSPV
jgi:hypothetical protein